MALLRDKLKNRMSQLKMKLPAVPFRMNAAQLW